ncbi:uncharacterized protein FTOL_00461 [Fusarium torulosum]|uniref:Uncharacterized protein n=1 Tax=Fusarium torulosum TaxID=33205 RepID=A0AAE8LYJ0_9HYPO|nr:uncharacterized protein FTOL_00461 [Fusarium torulosum]
MSLAFRHIALRHGEKQHEDLIALRTRALKYASGDDIRIFSICVDLPPQEVQEIEALQDASEESKSGSGTHEIICLGNTEDHDDDDASYPGSDQGEPTGNAVPWLRLREVNYQRPDPPTQDDANNNVSHTDTDHEGDVAMKEDDSDDRGSSTSTSDARDDPDYQNWIDENTQNGLVMPLNPDDREDYQSEASTTDASNCIDYQNWMYDNSDGNHGIPIDPRLEDTPMLNAPDSFLNDSSTNDTDVSDAVQKWLCDAPGTTISIEELSKAALAQDADTVLLKGDQHSPTFGDETSEPEPSDTFDIFQDNEDEAHSLDNPTNGEVTSSSIQLCSTTAQSHSDNDRDTGDAWKDDSSSLGSSLNSDSDSDSDTEAPSTLLQPRKDYWPEKLKRKLDGAEAKYKDYVRQREIFERNIASKVEHTGKIDDSELRNFVRNNVAYPPKVSVRELLELKDCIEDVVDFNYDGKRNLNEINREAHKRKALRYEPPGSTKRFRSKCLGSSLRYVIGIDQDWGDEDN